MFQRNVLIAAGVATLLSCMSAAWAGSMESTTTVHRFTDMTQVKGAEATLMRSNSGVAMKLSSSELPPSEAVTVWWVVFNHPENCSDQKCGENDVFNLGADEKPILNADGSAPLNVAGIDAADISILRADGHVIDQSGNAKYVAGLVKRDTSEAVVGPGLLHPISAEIHLVVRSHGPVQPGKLDDMLYSINGGCADKFPNPPCTDLQYSVFMPPK
jgi:hypothetical protein